MIPNPPRGTSIRSFVLIQSGQANRVLEFTDDVSPSLLVVTRPTPGSGTLICTYDDDSLWTQHCDVQESSLHLTERGWQVVVEFGPALPLEHDGNRSNPPALQVAVRLFSALAKGSRLAILQALGEGPQCVQDLVAELGLAQPKVSKELQVLSDAKLVTRSKRGTRVYYALRDRTVCQLIELAGEMALRDHENGVEDGW